MLDLNKDVKYVKTVGPNRVKLLNKLNIYTLKDLITYYPRDYEDRSKPKNLYECADGEEVLIEAMATGRISEMHKGRMTISKLIVKDQTGTCYITWFNQGYLRDKFQPGRMYRFFGKISIKGSRFEMNSPVYDEIDQSKNTGKIIPIYPLTYELKQSTLRRIIENGLAEVKGHLPETLPEYILKENNLWDINSTIERIHFPIEFSDFNKARERLVFEELLTMQLALLKLKNNYEHDTNGIQFSKDVHMSDVINMLPFRLTTAQLRVLEEIDNDMESNKPMNRLLQGDVGSGKTLVALMAMLIAVDNGFQACMMAPTEILAEQHLATIKDFLKGLNVRVELLTGIVKGKKRKEILEGVVTGDVQILVGTHAVIEETVQFHNLGLAVVDEQHRFGVAQRAKLWAKNQNPPHILVMTATPIPRTLAMTIYGDLDISVIDELPPGRKPIQTLHKYDNQMTTLYNGIRQQITLGRQVYIVYPLISESEKMDLKNLEDGFEQLQNIFPDYKMSKVHGRMKPAEKEAEMQRFASGETQILVATTVIEVGVNVPNASVMVIMEAQRFGLSQLHQLRGRVGRGADQSYCILVSGHELSVETRKRLEIMTETNDGFRIAEADLKLRGPGDLEGTQQSGLAFDLKIADIARDGQLVQLARDEAQKIIDEDPECNSQRHALLWRRLNELRSDSVDWAQIS